jgi:predicted O-methyltransferase YrrM
MTLSTIIVAAAIAVLASLLVIAAVRLNRLHAQQKRILRHLKKLEPESLARDISQFRQIVAYDDLRRIIAPKRPLPPMRGWAISPDFGLLLTELIESNRPATIVELGSGTSTLLCAYQLKKLGRGEVVAIDHDAAFAQQTRDQIRLHGLENYARVVTTRLCQSDLIDTLGNPIDWYYLMEAQPLPDDIDLLIVDGPPMPYGADVRYPALPIFKNRLSTSAALLLDDADRPGEQRIVARWSREFPEFEVAHKQAEKGAVILSRGKASQGTDASLETLGN